MQADERQRHILDRAREHGRVDVADIATELNVAPETVRRDLRLLDEHGLVRRTHGGATPVETAGFETGLAYRSTSRVQQKRRIARAAAERLGDAETVFVDEGITPQLVAEELPTSRPLTVVTASLPTAAALSAVPTTTVLLLGGRLRGRTMATVDHWVLRMLGEMVIDLAYVGANGISREHGLTTPDPAVGAVKAKAMEVSRRRVFVGIHTKFGAASFSRFAEVGDFEAIVTDTALPPAEVSRYAALGPKVIRV
ncbi:DeoR/GlpR family DNA-binding transcription regulator [Kutzneria viridogrisea]|uniref:Lactose phosphotransferase system repressor n=2 Tax=Kutzneria TaxID=43356 RepID=W5W5H4_9PSEU|nr:DeoR/GlpR family DNA-binding transcription regulator [Kutzneria albida]AHH96030.1 DeoR family transcription regulator [Kutzneria albida DSM 43870]MBA8928769.1 DeoR/GlpR family transcriptional regulator of sugar metabolism [Kutzneria viridogrisea]